MNDKRKMFLKRKYEYLQYILEHSLEVCQADLSVINETITQENKDWDCNTLIVDANKIITELEDFKKEVLV